MSLTYFKPRDRFDFEKDTLDIGNPLTWDRSQFLKHVFKRVFAIGADRLDEFYQRHLAYYLANHPDGKEEIFFKYFYGLIERQLKVLMGKDVYDKNHVRNEREIERLQKFTELLIPLDRWNFHKSNDAVIAQQDSKIHALEHQVTKLKADLKKATTLETEDYINIRAGWAHTLFDIILQLQNIELPDGDTLLYPATQIVWRRMICKYFREGGNEINFNSIHRYFPTDKRNLGRKYVAIAEKDKVFKLVLAKKRG
jgi:hypothetical protein